MLILNKLGAMCRGWSRPRPRHEPGHPL